MGAQNRIRESVGPEGTRYGPSALVGIGPSVLVLKHVNLALMRVADVIATNCSYSSG